MSTSFTYTTLTEALQDWPTEDSDEYVAALPTIIAMGEDRLIVDLNLDIFDHVDSTIVVTQGSRNVPKPTDLIQTRELYLISSGRRIHLKKRSRAYCMAYAPTPATQGTPQYFCELSDTNWMVVATPDTTGTAEAHYVRRPTGLSDANTSTWLSTKCGDLLLKACLLEAEQYLKADDRYADIATDYGALLNVRRMELRDSIRSGAESPFMASAKPVG